MSKNEAVIVSNELQLIAAKLDSELSAHAGRRVSFSLFVWTAGRANYISNSTDRKEIAAAVRAIIDGWEAGMPDVPAHKVE